MWTNNTRNTTIKGGSNISFFKILNGYENIDSNSFFVIKESKRTRGHNFTLAQLHFGEESNLIGGPSMHGINYQQSVHMLVVMFKNKIDKYLVNRGAVV